jgi:hypothetical protein
VPWGKQSKALLGGSTTLELSDAVSVTLTFRPVGVTVLVHRQPAVSFNGQQMFAMEHLREKKVQHMLHAFVIYSSDVEADMLAQVACVTSMREHCVCTMQALVPLQTAPLLLLSTLSAFARTGGRP